MNTILKINDRGEAVFRLQEWLNTLGATLKPDGHFGLRTDAALKLWQLENRLAVDGIFGPSTFQAMRRAVLRKLAGTDNLGLVTCQADPLQGGFNRLLLRADVANAYNRLRAALHSAGAHITTAGGLRALSDIGRPNTSKTSLHYPALAFDLALGSGANNPAQDTFVIELAHDGRWTVWARCTDPKAVNFPKIKTTIQNPSTYNQRMGTGVPVEDYFANFTALANRLGFNHIPPHRNWQNRNLTPMTALEWWHFQYETVLMPGFSTFGGELLTIYPQAAINAQPELARRVGLIWRAGWWG